MPFSQNNLDAGISLFNYCGRWCSQVQQSYSAQLCFICSFLFPLLKPSQGTIWFGRQRKQQMKFWPKLYLWPLTYTGLAGIIGRMQSTPLLNNNHIMWHFSMIFNIDVLQKFKCAKLPSFSLAFCVSSRKIILPDDLSWYLSGDQCDSTALLLVLISSSLANKTDNS